MTQALIVVDMQNGFCHPQGSLPAMGRGLPDIERAVRGCMEAVASAREADLPVVFTRHLYRPGYADAGPNFDLVGADLRAVGGLLAGSWDGDVIDELEVTGADLIVDKCRYDAFLNTSLDRLLRGMGVTRVTVCGVVTNVCVESTVRAAFMRDYGVELIADACAAATRPLHEAALEVISHYRFAEVVSLADGYRPGRVEAAA
ncbi:MAG TPA: isochorismatase family cysteine hydrolase [Acidimicrobiales bacterium]|nr:isochorismatase family cysteine hydrolase [Acidimicrobiales bacterium]